MIPTFHICIEGDRVMMEFEITAGNRLIHHRGFQCEEAALREIQLILEYNTPLNYVFCRTAKDKKGRHFELRGFECQVLYRSKRYSSYREALNGSECFQKALKNFDVLVNHVKRYTRESILNRRPKTGE